MAEITDFPERRDQISIAADEIGKELKKMQGFKTVGPENKRLIEIFGGRNIPRKFTFAHMQELLKDMSPIAGDENTIFSLSQIIEEKFPGTIDKKDFAAFEERFGSVLDTQDKGGMVNLPANDPGNPAADVTTKIKDQTLTIREAIEGAGKSLTTSKGAPNKFAKNIEAAGLSLDDPWSSIKDESFLRKLNEIGTEGNFVSLLTVENELRRLSSVGDIPFPYSDVFSPEGKARGLKDAEGNFLEKASQARRTKKFKGVPEAQKSLTALTEGISVIKDPRTRAAVAFNALVPLRPGEVAGIKVEDIDFETGSFKESYRRVNKIRNELDLPEVALEIIRDAAEKARAEGREYVFLDKDIKDPKKATGNFVNRMTTGMKMPGGVIERFKPFEKAMGRAVAGASDIRKIIPSIIAMELGYTTEASAIMGHASFDETIDGMKGITRKHYVSQIITDEGTTAKQALRALQNMYGEVLGLSTLNEIPASMGVDAAGLTQEGAPRLTVIPKGSEIVGTQVQGTLTDADLDLIEDVREARSQQLKLEATTAEKQRLEMEAQMGELDEEAERVRAQRRLRRQEIYRQEKAAVTTESPDPKSMNDLTPELQEKLSKGGFDLDAFLKGTDKALKGLLPVAIGTSAIVASREAVAQGDTPFVAGMKGVAAGASELVAPPGMAFSDREFREDQRATTPGGSGLGPRTDVAPQTDALGYIKPEFAMYPMEDAPRESFLDTELKQP